MPIFIGPSITYLPYMLKRNLFGENDHALVCLDFDVSVCGDDWLQ